MACQSVHRHVSCRLPGRLYGRASLSERDHTVSPLYCPGLESRNLDDDRVHDHEHSILLASPQVHITSRLLHNRQFLLGDHTCQCAHSITGGSGNVLMETVTTRPVVQAAFWKRAVQGLGCLALRFHISLIYRPLVRSEERRVVKYLSLC